MGQARQRQQLVRLTGAKQRARQLQAVEKQHVVIRRAVDQQQRSRQPRRIGQKRGAVVAVFVLGGQAQIALGIAGVVVPPVDHRSARHADVKHIRPAQYRQRRHVAAKRPAVDADPRQVQLGIALAGLGQRRDLVFQRQVAKVTRDGMLPRRAAVGSPAPIGGHDDKAMIRNPLIQHVARR